MNYDRADNMLRQLEGLVERTGESRAVIDGGDQVSKMWGILSGDNFETAFLRQPQGAYFPDHVHDHTEVVVILKGAILVSLWYDPGEPFRKLYSAGEVMIFPPRLRHGGRAVRDAELLCINLGNAGDYPSPMLEANRLNGHGREVAGIPG